MRLGDEEAGEAKYDKMDRNPIRRHQELKVYQVSFASSMEIYHLTKGFPREEIYSLTDQIRRSSRYVSTSIAEVWRKRRYPKLFVAKLVDTEAEAAETQVWLAYAQECEYINEDKRAAMFDKYDHIIAMLVNMYNNLDKWIL